MDPPLELALVLTLLISLAARQSLLEQFKLAFEGDGVRPQAETFQLRQYLHKKLLQGCEMDQL